MMAIPFFEALSIPAAACSLLTVHIIFFCCFTTLSLRFISVMVLKTAFVGHCKPFESRPLRSVDINADVIHLAFANEVDAEFSSPYFRNFEFHFHSCVEASERACIF